MKIELKKLLKQPKYKKEWDLNQKLENDPNQLETANSATANMYIINPFKKNGEKGKKKTSNLWSTHPSTEDRIEALRNIK